ncbi:MAG TPA: M56 family metallopeptidase [Candidatus Acidoferrales bacterium]|nr:M56 family metallopeptidase [Candidatus Acidoferrales bacterium]
MMERLFLECTIRAALLAGGTAIVLYAMRVKPPAVKHRVWTGVLALMLILPAWTVWGPKVSVRVLPALPEITANATTSPSTTALTALTALPAVSTREAALLGLYLLGLCAFLIRLATGTFRARRLAREAVVDDGVRTSRFCTAPVTVGFFHPVVILPERWREWPRTQLDAILTHEGEHARRRDSLVQWLALLNHAVFWFHPAAWWLERNLSALAEQACDDAVLAHGHNPRAYAEYLIDIARSMAHSGARMNLAGMAMPGTFLPQRIRKIVESGQTPRISRTRMVCAVAVCLLTCTAFAAGRLDHAAQNSTPRTMTTQRDAESVDQASSKFVLGDLKIEGDVHDSDAVRERVLNQFKGRGYSDAKTLDNMVARAGVIADLENRGYFNADANVVGSQALGIAEGKKRMLLTVSVDEGEQYHIASLNVHTSDPSMTTIPPPQVVQDLVHVKRGDLYDVSKLRAGLARIKQWYAAHDPADAKTVYENPQFKIDDAHHVIDVTITVGK